jgi:hypothetical protein
MSLRDRHEAFLAYTVESRDHYGQDVSFDISNDELKWHNDVSGVITNETFILGGLVNVVTGEENVNDAAGVVVESFNVTVRLSSLKTECGGIPATGTVITAITRNGTVTGIVEQGQTHVDSDIGRVHYMLSSLEVVA